MSVLLALASALAYGLSDFIGGLLSRRTSAWPVAFVGGLGMVAGAVLLALTVPGSPSPGDLAWGAVAGVGSGLGGAFLYRGFARGRMGVVAPVSAVGAALLPVVVGVGTGERPPALAWLGILVAFPGIWLVSREPGQQVRADGLADGLLAGLGFGVLFAALGQVPDGAGYWPLALAQGVAVVAIAVTASLLHERWVPGAASELWGLVAGALATLGVWCFLLAPRAACSRSRRC